MPEPEQGLLVLRYRPAHNPRIPDSTGYGPPPSSMPNTGFEMESPGAHPRTRTGHKGSPAIIGHGILAMLPSQYSMVRALGMADEEHPILAVQAAFGTGKTAVRFLMAVRAFAPHQIAVATATTNITVAQFTDTWLSEYRHLDVL
ncbi:hypothetical protein Y032_0528g2987 [Ancylostoma ceylanicum]|uniref:Uncharacterized protein n=1 Tax=Ancylostoma ceylanicum TaxID=53326 RepID=A0A016WSJ2_9BILA|nr:hypothetical protein Y032_0528g2987 [Ancylostoma ceylanicum]